MNQILSSRKSSRTAVTLVLICMLIVILAVLSFSFAVANMGSDKIISNVRIDGIPVDGLTKEEAKILLQQTDRNIANTNFTLKYKDRTTVVTSEEMGIKFDVDGAIEQAYSCGREGNILANNYTILITSLKGTDITILPDVDEEKFEELLEELRKDIPDAVLDDAYEIKEDTLVITKGKKGTQINKEALRQLIISNVSKENVEIVIPTIEANPNRLNIDSVYSEIKREPKNASYGVVDGVFQVNKEENGLDFNKDEAKQEYAKLNDGEKAEIKLVVTKPEVSIPDLNEELFKDVLSSYETKYDKYYTTRAENLRLAAEKINGKIVYPGETFSYNQTVGPRTAAAGFKLAHVFEGGRVVDGLGGGICQVSTTLYNVVLLADLEVVQRAAHAMHTGYVQPGRDATVVYGAIDFKFKNNRDLPIKIVCSVVDGICKFEIRGIKKETDPIIDIETVILKTVYPTTIYENDSTMESGTTKVVQTPMNGYTSETYKIVKNAAGEQISRTFISKDVYKVTNKIVKVGTKVTAPVEPVTPTQPVVETPVTEPPVVEEPQKPSLPPGWDSPESPYVY